MTTGSPPPGRLARLLAAGHLGPPTITEAAPPDKERSEELQQALRRLSLPTAPGAPDSEGPRVLDELVMALDPPPRLRREQTESGTVTSLTWRNALDDRHGRHALSEALSLPAEPLACALRDPRLAGFSAREALFLDIESTGLGHGAGTYAFLIGLAWFETDALVVQELFLENPCDEAAMLARFAEIRASRPFLVSFNGRCYDVHVLQSRLVLNRVYGQGESELRLCPHVDLLHLARPLLKGLLPDHRLQTLERERLGVTRHDDVVSALIPSLYFNYLHDSDTTRLAPVLRHNAVDVLSMVSLLGHLGALLDESTETMAPALAANLGALWLTRKDPARALPLLQAAAEGSSPSPFRAEQRARQVQAAKRLLVPPFAPALLEALREGLDDWLSLCPDSAEAHAEASRFHERHERDYARAAHHARLALEHQPGESSAEEIARAKRRLARLDRRATRC